MAKNDNPFFQAFTGQGFPGIDMSAFQMPDLTKMMQMQKMPGFDMESLMNTQRKNLEALANANKLAMEGFQAVLQRQAEIMKTALEEASNASRGMMAQGKPDEKMSAQADLMKDAFEKAVTNMREIAEIATKANSEAMEVINKRVAETMEEMKNLSGKGR